MNRDAIREVGRVPHGSSDDPDVFDFSANTNPLVPDGVEEIYRSAFEESRTYPPEPPTAFREAAAAYVDCEPEHVVPTPGGLAAIRLVVGLAIQPGDSALIPSPSFAEYAREVRLHGGAPTFEPADRILEADPSDHVLAIICTPNNPTGAGYDRDELSAYAARCRAAGTLLLVDEAFLGFTDRPSLAEMPGVVVARSLTKLFGLPGIRCGFAVATGEVREDMEVARRPWNVSTPALATGAHCMGQSTFVEDTRERVGTERARMADGLRERFDVHPSDAPFLLLDVGTGDVTKLLERALARGIALRDARTFRGLDSHVRVAVRLPAENDRLLGVLCDG